MMNWKKLNIKNLALTSLLLTALALPLLGQVELRYRQNETVSWDEAIRMYEWLDEMYEEATLMEAGMTDAGKPLHLFIISKDQIFSPAEARKAGKTVLFINNGIHPGEPCGVDASLELASGLLSGLDPYNEFLENTVLVIVPIFNIGGALNRGKYHRANQNGPIEHGFRGNARNLDLNRDFIKLDSRNTRSLTTALREWKPDLFVDTHTSNGADYPYVITLINSHEQRHQPSQSALLRESVLPFLFRAMKDSPYEMSPYIWSYNKTPDKGIVSFLDYPRYTSGYTSLYNTLSFIVEAHMFKPYSDRVLSTWHLLREILRFSDTHVDEILYAKELAWKEKMACREFILDWELDSSRFEMIPFKGYKARYKPSEITGFERLWYDRTQVWEKEIPYYRFFKPLSRASVPEYYILPSAWSEVIECLQLNLVEMTMLEHDTVMKVEVSYIESYKTSDSPYNGHYRHHDVSLRKTKEDLRFLAGDWIIPARQEAIEYLVQTLEPGGYDSFFSWNFFDEILNRNEYFSPYIFEETAGKLLETDDALAREFKEKQDTDPAFAANPYLQLRYIYERSPWSEASFMRYPVYRSLR